MSTSTITKSVNDGVLNLWREEFGDRLDKVKCPLLYPDLPTGGILFIGCNPALPKRNHYSVPCLESVWDNEYQVAELIKRQHEVHKSYPYFRPCNEIAASLGMEWAHVDWFFQRVTSQTELEDEVLGEPATWDEPVELSNFARKQIQLSRKLMDACQPQIVVVANAFASKIAKWEFNLGTLDQHGLMWANISGKGVPLFLSGMLTGQRALDRGSRDRLEWHLRHAMKLIGQGNN